MVAELKITYQNSSEPMTYINFVHYNHVGNVKRRLPPALRPILGPVKLLGEERENLEHQKGSLRIHGRQWPTHNWMNIS
jgi:hypothetical protein